MASSRSIRFKVSVLLATPLVSLVAVWGFAAAVTVGDSISLSAIDTLYESVGKPVGTLSSVLQREHIRSAEYLAARSTAEHTALAEQRTITDQARTRLRQDMDGDAVRSQMSDEMRTRYVELLGQVDELDAIRARIDSGRIGPVGLSEEFAKMSAVLHRFVNVLSLNEELPFYRQLRSATTVDQAMNLISRERALVTGSLVSKSPLTASETRLFTQLVGNRAFLVEQALPELEPALRAPFAELFASSTYVRFTGVEHRLLSGGSVSAAEWRAAGDALDTAYQQAVMEIGPLLVKRAEPATMDVYIRAGLVGGFGLVAVIVSLLVSYRIGTGIARELAAVRRAATDLADTRLPRVMEKLRRGERVDVDAEAPPLKRLGSTAEIHAVAGAFDSVRRSAVDAAVEQARLREGAAHSFRNLARRSQSLLQRQLKLLDGMQKRAENPEALENLFKLDHLTTRMRRHAEGLVILAGGAAGRKWRSAVPMEDVLRGAAAQVEDYARVRIYPMGGSTLIGNAVADMMHLFAEILENAAAFSPPGSQVSVRGEPVSRGFVIEIEDRGLGLTEEKRSAINERLSSPPEFDPADTDRLGFAVVGLLAARYGVEVTLRSSPYGGTGVVVLVPEKLLGDPEPVEPPAGPPVLTVISVGPESEEQVEQPAPSGETEEQAVPIPADLWRPLRRGGGGLPRRTRQANTPPIPAGRPPARAEIEERSPEEARALMSALQSGWQRGRAADQDGGTKP